MFVGLFLYLKIEIWLYILQVLFRRDVPVGVPLDLSTPTGMSSIGTCGENCKSDNVPKYRGLLVAFLFLRHEKLMSRKLIIYYLFYFFFSEN